MAESTFTDDWISELIANDPLQTLTPIKTPVFNRNKTEKEMAVEELQKSVEKAAKLGISESDILKITKSTASLVVPNLTLSNQAARLNVETNLVSSINTVASNIIPTPMIPKNMESTTNKRNRNPSCDSQGSDKNWGSKRAKNNTPSPAVSIESNPQVQTNLEEGGNVNGTKYLTNRKMKIRFKKECKRNPYLENFLMIKKELQRLNIQLQIERIFPDTGIVILVPRTVADFNKFRAISKNDIFQGHPFEHLHIERDLRRVLCINKYSLEKSLEDIEFALDSKEVTFEDLKREKKK